MATKRYVHFAFALVVLGAGLAIARVAAYEKWDEQLELSFVPVEIESQSAETGQSRARLNLLATECPEADVFVHICSNDGSLTTLGAVELRFIRWNWQSSSDTGAVSIASDYEVVWTELPLAEGELAPAPRRNCLVFNGRGAGGGDAQLLWDPGAFGDRTQDELHISVAVRQPIASSDQAIVVLLLAAMFLLFAAGQRTERRRDGPWPLGDASKGLLGVIVASVLGGCCGFGRTG